MTINKVILVTLITLSSLSVVHYYVTLVTSNSKDHVPGDTYRGVNSQCYLISCSKGNFGNQIWEYMSLFVVWQRFAQHGHVPYIEEDMQRNLESVFKNLTISNFTRINTMEFCTDVKGRWTIPKTDSLEKYADWFQVDWRCRDIFLDDYSTRYEDILNIKSKIQEEMRFHTHLVKRAHKTLMKIRKKFRMSNKKVTFVGIHYRGDDYVDHLKTYYDINSENLPDYNYYRRAMNYFKRKYKYVIFILITVDQFWLKKNESFIKSAGNVVVNPNGDDRINDLVLLSHCNHSIISYGTFGVTTGFFAGGTTFVYDLNLPLDHRGATIALGFASLLDNWHAII